MIAGMIGFDPRESWAHITSGGTVANIEALWVARMAQFLPLIVQEFCQRENLDYPIRLANGKIKAIVDVPYRDLLHLPPNRAIKSIKRLTRYLVDERHEKAQTVFERLNAHIQESAFNPGRRGYFSIYEKTGLRPLLFVSASAHYSIAKAVNILGYGEDQVISVPVDKNFRMDAARLAELLSGIDDKSYIAGVVSVMGSTEEGAVDPTHRVHHIRRQLEKNDNRSFWLHVDAAWGGYVKSLFCGLKNPDGQRINPATHEADDYIRAINARETISLPGRDENKKIELIWNDPEVYGAYLAMHHADSVTIDPHKMGYIPYPAGIVAFGNGLVTDLMAQKAPYISDVDGSLNNMTLHPAVHAIGPYILEGSKPGAAAAACWLSHKTIPLKAHGHGKIIRTALLNAQKLYHYLLHHRKMFSMIESEIREFQKYAPEVAIPFTFQPLYRPDTNVVCFIAIPDIGQKEELGPWAGSLKRLNRFNEAIYREMTISGVDIGHKPPYGQPYFVSRTRFESRQYGFETVAGILQPFNITEDDYRKNGLFVLRSTVMNPFYYLAEQEGKNYLLDFVKYLHLTTRKVANKLSRHSAKS